jgi:hypothetical protein
MNRQDAEDAEGRGVGWVEGKKPNSNLVLRW